MLYKNCSGNTDTEDRNEKKTNVAWTDTIELNLLFGRNPFTTNTESAAQNPLKIIRSTCESGKISKYFLKHNVGQE